VTRAAAMLCCCLLWPAAHAGDPLAAELGSDSHPLLDLARELAEARKPGLRTFDAPELRPAEHALEQAHPPADADCAGSLGAPVFAGLHNDVAQARKAQGDFRGAVLALRRALACSPRNAWLLGSLADALFDARDVPAAREAIQQAISIHPNSVYLARIAAKVDFVQERWADAVSRYRFVAASEPDRTRASYAQIMYWLAQMRAGVAKPEFVARRQAEDWPKPLMLYLQDQYTESELVFAIREGEDEDVDVDERLCEALYYVGEAHLARGDRELARRHFAALVNIRIIDYIEHGLALAEIAKLSQRAD
jgi:lipoprotein NlpI